MTTFSEIRDNALGYKKGLNNLNSLVLQLSAEKQKGEPLVTWFRLRNRRVAQVIDPAIQELKQRIKDEKRRVANISKSVFTLKRVNNLVESQQIELANRFLNESIEKILEETIVLSKNVDTSIEQLEIVKQELNSEKSKSINNINYYDSSEKKLDKIKQLLLSTRTTKEIDIPAFTEAINSVNSLIKILDIDVPEMKQLPDTFDKNKIQSLHEEIRSVVGEIDSRYKMKLFADSIRVVRIIIHDVGNDRGRRAFNKRSEELIETTEEAVQKFNNKYWQITGKRWERTGREQWGYVTVKPTHQPI